MKCVSYLFVTVFIFLMGGGGAGAGGNDCFDEVPQLAVRGEALLSVPADQMQMNMGVVTSADTAEEALELNTQKMKRVEKALLKTGLVKDEYRTGRFQIQPKWMPRPRQAPKDWQPRIAGYSVTNSLQVKTRKLKLAGKLIEAGIEAGANQINSIIFNLADPRKFRSRAIEKATANAKADAASLARAAGVNLAGILLLKLENTAEVPKKLRLANFMESAAPRGDVSPPISPEDVTVRASIMLIYRIK
jgi:uncharacterized protein